MTKKRHRLIYAREHAEHSQRSLASAIGVSKSTIYGYENGYFLPQMNVRKKVARELGVPLSWFTEKPLSI